MLNDKLKNYLHLHLLVFIAGFTAILGELISINAIPLVWFRMMIAAFLMIGYIKIRKINVVITFKTCIKFSIAGIFIALHWITFFESIKQSNISIALAMFSTGAFFASFIEPIFFKRKLIWFEILFGLLVILGVWVITQSEIKYTKGIILGIFSALFSTIFAVINGKFVKRYSASVISFYEFISGVLFISLYIIIFGGGDSPNFTDKIRVKYSGNLLDGQVFDSSVSPIDFDLVSLVPGWNRVMTQFNSAESFIENGDGTINYINPGVGVMFLPSGLAYFSGSVGGIPAFSPLIFKIEFYQTEINDHDSDGIPTFLEDINQDIDVTNDDTDEDLNLNFVDNDDDGDGVLTFNELEPIEYIVNTNIGETEPILDQKEFEINRTQNAGVITIQTVKIVDSDGDGLDDYLDENITINYNEGS